jgi:hypothetical protein
VPDKAQRVFSFHQNTLKALKELVEAAGLQHPNQIKPWHLVRRVDDGQVKLLSNYYPFLTPGELLTGPSELAVFKLFWPKASPDTFAAQV